MGNYLLDSDNLSSCWDCVRDYRGGKIMFENVKVGDSLYDVCFGWGRVKAINCLDYSDKAHLIEVEFSHMKKFTYSKKGINLDLGCTNQTLFWDEIKFEVPEIPFSLEDELRKLEVVEFEYEKDNTYLAWNYEKNEIDYFFEQELENPGLLYFELDDVIFFLENIESKVITKEQFFETYKKVFGGNN